MRTFPAVLAELRSTTALRGARTLRAFFDRRPISGHPGATKSILGRIAAPWTGRIRVSGLELGHSD